MTYATSLKKLFEKSYKLNYIGNIINKTCSKVIQGHLWGPLRLFYGYQLFETVYVVRLLGALEYYDMIECN